MDSIPKKKLKYRENESFNIGFSTLCRKTLLMLFDTTEYIVYYTTYVSMYEIEKSKIST